MDRQPIREVPEEEKIYRVGKLCNPSPLFESRLWNSVQLLTYPKRRYGKSKERFRDLIRKHFKYVPADKSYLRQIQKKRPKLNYIWKLKKTPKGTHFRIPYEVFAAGKRMGAEGRNQYHANEHGLVHAGIDFYGESRTPILAPFKGKVVGLEDAFLGQKPNFKGQEFIEKGQPGHNPKIRDPLFSYGPVLVLEHDICDLGVKISEKKIQRLKALGLGKFYTIYGHVSRESIETVKEGDTIEKGQPVAEMGDTEINGAWSPHLHFQITLHKNVALDFRRTGAALPENVPNEVKYQPNPGLLFATAKWFKKVESRNEFRKNPKNLPAYSKLR
ncbi:MAG: peptidoglycan DD-metalloendopeptidase family protein [Candidatus Micrarchaeota archaeon]